jgi:type III pantothenate kinase
VSAPAFTVDVGNSSVGVADWRSGPPRLQRVAEPEQAAALLHGDVAVVSVAPARFARLASALPAGARLTLLLEAPPDLGEPRLLRSAGSDRLAVALALRPGPAVAVDAGTAVTVEVVDGSGRYRGGFIAPGPRAALAGLAAATAQLPALEAGVVPLQPGSETRAALLAGTWGMAVGGVDRLVEDALAALGGGSGVRIVATGGWGEAWSRDTRLRGVAFEPALVHHGIARWRALA